MPALTSLEQCAQDIMDTIPAVMHFMRTEMRLHTSSTLSVPQFRVLAYLRRHDGVSFSAVAAHLGVTRATVSAMVDGLVRKGLVDRVVDCTERRRSVLTLTDAGSALFESALAATRRRLAEALSSFSPRQIAQLAGAMRLLNQVLREADTFPAAGNGQD